MHKKILSYLGSFLLLIFSLAFSFFLAILSYLIPKNPKLVLFGSGYGTAFRGHPKYLYLYRNKDFDKYEYLWITRSKDLFNKLKSEGYNSVYMFSLKGFWSILRSKYIIIDSSSVDFTYFSFFFGRFSVVQTWHGTGFKNIVKLKDSYLNKGDKKEKVSLVERINNFKANLYNSTRYVFVCATSELDKERKSLSFNAKNVFITGSPRNDIFFDEALREKDYKKELKLGKYRRVLLYVPTYRDNQVFEPFTLEFFSKLQKLLEKNNDVFLVKRHPLDSTDDIPSEYKNILDVTSKVSDVQELLVITDILITDYSGIVTDFVLTNRPVIFYTYDYDEYLDNCRDFYYNLKEILPGPFLSSEEDLLKKLGDFDWFSDPKYQKGYQAFVNKFHKYKDSSSRLRVLNCIFNKKHGK